MRRITAVLTVLAAGMVLLAACGGGGGGPSDDLVRLDPGREWVYRLSGSLTLPDTAGGGTQTIRDTVSTLTVTVTSATENDAAGNPTRAIDRKLKIEVLDGRTFEYNLRLYVTQDESGIYLHGYHDYAGAASGAPRWVSATANPPAKFLYLPDPALDDLSASYANPFGLAPAAGYSFNIWGPRVPTEIAGEPYSAKRLQIVERFHDVTFTPPNLFDPAFSPQHGLLAATVNAKLPGGATLAGSIELKR